MQQETWRLRSDELEAEVAALGAELVRLTWRGGTELLWQGDPASWTGQSPILFPVVGRVREGIVRVGGDTFPMPQHGFALTSRFELVEADAASCRLRLRDDATTRRHYPFAFELGLHYRLDGRHLRVEAEIKNPGEVPLPASFGFHPGFAWPLLPGLAKADHHFTFAADETLEVARLEGGLLGPERETLALERGRLALHEGLFAKGAMVMTRLDSRSVTYGAKGSEIAIEVAFEHLPHLAFWMRPGADYVCIEPWHGYADPVGFAGQLADKPGGVLIPPGGRQCFALGVHVRTGTTP